MKKLIVILFCRCVGLHGYNSHYKETEAKIIDLKIENGNYTAEVEDYVNNVRYIDEFEIISGRIINDSISKPHSGITFTILYHPSDPQRNKIDFNVKANYLKSE